MADTKYTLDNDAHQELVGLLEDSVAQFCQDNLISGDQQIQQDLNDAEDKAYADDTN